MKVTSWTDVAEYLLFVAAIVVIVVALSRGNGMVAVSAALVVAGVVRRHIDWER